jgi:threonine/homoserine/homoserine lactone efflux protein
MALIWVFFVGLIFSFLGSIPPGTLNLSVLQLGLEGKTNVAMRFALAVAIIEYPYAWIGVQFQYWITSSPIVTSNFQLITAIVMTVLGIFTIWSGRRPTNFSVRFNESGFRRGILLSLLNPMAIPFWVGVTAYLKAQSWIDISTRSKLHSYVFGTSIGALLLLTLFTFGAKRLSRHVQNNRIVKLLPGYMLVMLGLYAFFKYLT